MACVQDFELITNVAVALGLALAGGLAARAIRLSPIVGYLAAGVIISPFTPGYDANSDQIRELAELGVIFLMFGVGLHFNLRDLLAVKGIAIPGAAIQVTAASALGTAIGLVFDLPLREALVLGLAISVASTVVLIRSLEERGLMDTVHGRVAVGWLVAQDVVTILFLALLPSLDPESSGNGAAEIAWAIVKAALFIGVLAVAGGRIIPWLLMVVARTGSRELFILSVVAIALGIATGATAFGLSVALGAFVAGVAISESETSHQVAADVIPLRDAFAVLFFVSVGMLLDPGVIADNAGLFAAVVLAVLAGNAVIAFATAASFAYPGRTALVVGAGLAQLGEFSFIVADEGRQQHLVNDGTYNVILGASAVSITANPLAFASLPALERLLHRLPFAWRIIDRRREGPAEPEIPHGPHVVVVGYGRVGELTGHALVSLGVPFVAIDADMERVRRLVAAGVPALWGDAANVEALARAGVGHANLVVVAAPDAQTRLIATRNVRRLNASVPLVVRGQNAEEAGALREMGAQEVVVPEYEGGLELMRQALVALGYDSEEALHLSIAARDVAYQAAAAEDAGQPARSGE